MAVQAQAAPDLGLTFGILEIGTDIAIFLTGIATLQAWNYFRDFPDDAASLKVLVAFLYLADSAHTILISHATYTYTIRHFGDYAVLPFVTEPLLVSIVIGGILAFVVQTFYCFRVLRLSRSRVIAGVCWAMAILRFALNINIAVRGLQYPRWDIVQTHALRWELATLQCVGSASDVLIAGTIATGLSRLRSGTSRDKLVDKLVAFAVGSGLFTSLVAICEAVTFLAMDNFVWVAFYGTLTKLFVNSLLASLNERDHVRRELAAWRSEKSSRVVPNRVTTERPERSTTVELSSMHGATDIENDSPQNKVSL